MAVGAPEQILSGKYRLERELGRGGMGSVWLAQHLTLRSPVAIKLIDAEIATNPEALSRFLREAQAAASLRSPHVVQILDHGVDAGVPFIVMELLEGESLSGRLERAGRLSPADTARILTQVGRAMTKAHEAGIVHRDLKPDNIFLVRNDEDEIAKVLDFGVAKSNLHGVASVSSATRTGSVLGTPYYMSPEQAEGAKTLDHRTDIWAMGVIAWECLIGSRPFDAETLGGLLLAICARDMPTPSQRGSVPAGFDVWFARACARDLSQRFMTAKEAAQELRNVCAGEVIQGYAPAPISAHGAVPAGSLPLASTTAHLGLSTAAPVAKKSAAPWLVLGALGVLVVGGGALLAMRSANSDARSSAAQVAAAPPSEAPHPPTPADVPVANAPDTKPASAPGATQAAAQTSASAAAPSVVPAPARVAASATRLPAHAAALKPRLPASPEKPKPAAPATPAAAPAPAAAQPAPPASKPRVNLGI